MARKPNSMYRQITQHAYTRRKYMGGVPGSRLLQFEGGTANRDYPVHIVLRVDEEGQVRSQAIEAARIAGNRWLEKKIGKANYFFKVRVYPHNVLRENKQATGAGADRVSQGMRRAFGAPIGTAARMQKNQALLEVRCPVEHVPAAKQGLWKAAMKIASPCFLDVEKGRELIA